MSIDAAAPGGASWNAGRLSERAAVEDLHYAFGQALDTNDWALYRACLDEQLHVDYSQSAGLPAVTTTGDLWTAFVAQCVEPQQTVHYYSNIRVHLDEDRAQVRLNHQSHHRVETRNGDATNIQVGTYETALAKRGSAWRLTAITHRASWVTGNPALIDSTRPSWIAAHAAVFGGR